MFRSLAAGLAAAVAAIAFPVAASGHGHNTPCTIPAGWYGNPDEQDRLPTPTGHGLQFAGNDLIHHATTGTVEGLTHGTFTARPAPDQTSFFSVEVYGTDGGYATLRWNTTTSVWDMTTGGVFYSNPNPAALVDMVTPHKSHHLLSFGVGYTANPPGTVTTTVSSVTFGRQAYSLACVQPKPSHSPSHSTSPSASVSASASASASPSTSASSSASASTSASSSESVTAAAVPTSTSPTASSGGLPLTGPDGRTLGAVAAALVLAGAGVFVLARRRKTRFTA